LKALNHKPEKYQRIIKFYKEKLVELGVMKKLKNSCKTLGQKCIKKKTVA